MCYEDFNLLQIFFKKKTHTTFRLVELELIPEIKYLSFCSDGKGAKVVHTTNAPLDSTSLVRFATLLTKKKIFHSTVYIKCVLS